MVLGQWTEPNNSGGDEDCSMMFWWWHESKGKWADQKCSGNTVFGRKIVPFCERDIGMRPEYFPLTNKWEYTKYKCVKYFVLVTISTVLVF